MSKKIISICILILAIITVIATYNAIILHKQNKKINEYLNYINSSEIDNELSTPNFFHVVLSAYDGEVSDLSILKSISYFINEIVPELDKKCNNDLSTKFYYSTHKVQLLKQINIENSDEFEGLVNKCNQLETTSKLSYAKFNAEDIKKEDDGVSAILHLKYLDGEDMVFEVKILNTEYSNKTSVIIK